MECVEEDGKAQVERLLAAPPTITRALVLGWGSALSALTLWAEEEERAAPGATRGLVLALRRGFLALLELQEGVRMCGLARRARGRARLLHWSEGWTARTNTTWLFLDARALEAAEPGEGAFVGLAVQRSAPLRRVRGLLIEMAAAWRTHRAAPTVPKPAPAPRPKAVGFRSEAPEAPAPEPAAAHPLREPPADGSDVLTGTKLGAHLDAQAFDLLRTDPSLKVLTWPLEDFADQVLHPDTSLLVARQLAAMPAAHP